MRKLISLTMALLLVMSLPMSVLAVEANVSYGDVSIGDTDVTHTKEEGGSAVTESHGGSVTVTGSSESNTVTITAGSSEESANVHVEIKTEEGGNTNVVLDNANIESPRGAVEVTGGGDVVIELDGANSLESTDNNKAGLQVGSESSVTIQDANNDGGSLTAQGAIWGAGIGGNANEEHGDITITGGTINATGGSDAAGIGGGQGTVNGNITITGGNVTAQGDYGAAGIGSGNFGSYSEDGSAGDITITGGEITATGGTGAAGIGGGKSGVAGDITISGGTVIANGGADYFETGGAGIGSGSAGNMVDITISGDDNTVSGNDITISGGDITATGGGKAADIGHGTGANQQFPDVPVNVTISGDAEIKSAGQDEVTIGSADRSAEVTVDTSKLTPEGSINGVPGIYVPSQPAPEPEYEEETPVYRPAPAPQPVEEEEEISAELTVKLDVVEEVIDLAQGTQGGKPMEKIEAEAELESGEKLPVEAVVTVHKVEIKAEETVENVEKESVGLVFAVSYMENGTVSRMPGMMKLSIPAPEESIEGFVLVFVLADGTHVEIPYEIVDGNIVFTSDYVGLYMMVKK